MPQLALKTGLTMNIPSYYMHFVYLSISAVVEKSLCVPPVSQVSKNKKRDTREPF